jgi:hypothetical protein
MKTTMKLWMGAAVAILMATGCGGTPSPEEACEQVESSFKELDEKLDDCNQGFLFASLYNQAACIEGTEACSDKDIENTLSRLDCVVDLMSCAALVSESTDAKLEACEDEFPVSASCDEGTVEVGSNSVVRAAKGMLRNREFAAAGRAAPRCGAARPVSHRRKLSTATRTHGPPVHAAAPAPLRPAP